MRQRIAVALVLALSATGASAAPSGAVANGGAVEEAELRNEQRALQVQPAAGEDAPALAFAYVGRVSASVPAGSARPARDVLGTSSYLDPTEVDGLDAQAPYLAWAIVENEHPALEHGSGYAGQGYYYGHVPQGREIHDGDYSERFVLHKGQYPLFPPRAALQAEPAGALVWEPVAPVTALVEEREADSGTVRRSQAGGFAANLRVDGGDLLASTAVDSEELRVGTGVSSEEFCFVIAFIHSAIPGVEVDVTFGSDVADGERVTWYRATVQAGSAWPESDDDTPGGTWKLRLNVVWACSAWTVGDGGETDADGLPDVRDTEAVAAWLAARGTRVRVADPAGAQQKTAHLAMGPGGTPTPVTVAGSQSAAVTADPATDAEVNTTPCDPTEAAHRNAGIGDLLPASAVGFDLVGAGTVEDLCVGGWVVGRFGFPVVEVDGVLHEPAVVGGPQVWEEPVAVGGSYRLVYRVFALARAGPVAFHAGYIVIVEADQVLVMAFLADHHATEGEGYGLRFPWYLDPVTAEGERFLVHGQVPLAVEAILPAPVDPGQPELSHTVAAPDWPIEHTIHHPQGPGSSLLVYDAERSPSEAAGLTLVDLLPPRSLDGKGVALLVPQALEGPRGGDPLTPFFRHWIHLD